MSGELHRAIEQIAADRRSGATELARRALGVLEQVLKVEPAQTRQEMLESVVEQLMAVRPSMSGLAHVAIRASRGSGTRHMVDVTSAAGVRKVFAKIRALRNELDTGARALARQASAMLRGCRKRMTLSSSRSVLAVMRGLADAEHQEGRSELPCVFVAESRPRCEGIDTARRLAAMGYPVRLIADAAMGHHVSECDAALIGADTVLADGTVYNKMGSLSLALACRHWRVPLYALTLAHKIRLTDDEPELEEMDAEELGQMPEGVAVRNVYFEVVPAEFVTALVSDLGTLTPDGIAQLRRKWLGGCEGDHG